MVWFADDVLTTPMILHHALLNVIRSEPVCVIYYHCFTFVYCLYSQSVMLYFELQVVFLTCSVISTHVIGVFTRSE